MCHARPRPEPSEGRRPNAGACLHHWQFDNSKNVQNYWGSWNIPSFRTVSYVLKGTDTARRLPCEGWRPEHGVSTGNTTPCALYRNERELSCECEGLSPWEGQRAEHVFVRTKITISVPMIGMNAYLVQRTNWVNFVVRGSRSQALAGAAGTSTRPLPRAQAEMRVLFSLRKWLCNSVSGSGLCTTQVE